MELEKVIVKMSLRGSSLGRDVDEIIEHGFTVDNNNGVKNARNSHVCQIEKYPEGQLIFTKKLPMLST